MLISKDNKWDLSSKKCLPKRFYNFSKLTVPQLYFSCQYTDVRKLHSCLGHWNSLALLKAIQKRDISLVNDHYQTLRKIPSCSRSLLQIFSWILFPEALSIKLQRLLENLVKLWHLISLLSSFVDLKRPDQIIPLYQELSDSGIRCRHVFSPKLQIFKSRDSRFLLSSLQWLVVLLVFRYMLMLILSIKKEHVTRFFPECLNYGISCALIFIRSHLTLIYNIRIT